MKSKIAIAISLLLLLTWTSCNTTDKDKPTLKIGYQNSPISTLLFVAKDKGFFDSTGLNVEMYSYTAGKFAVTDLISGKGIDVALSGELPIVYARLQGNTPIVFSQVVQSTTNECRIIARKDGDLNTPETYFSKRRTILTSKKGTPEYFLHEYIKKHNLDTSRLNIIGGKPEDMVSSLLNKSNGVDAICIFDPVASIATKQMKENGIVFQDPDMYSALYIVSALENTVKTRHEDLVKFVKGLQLAAAYCKAHPDEAKTIVTKYTTQPRDILDALWGNYDFDIALTSKLPNYFEQEVIWARASGDTSLNHANPNFRVDVIDTTILHDVDPTKIMMH